MKMINTIQSVPRHFASKVKEVLSFTKRRRRGNDDGMALRSKLWFYLKELEAEMNNWVRGEKVYLNISNFCPNISHNATRVMNDCVKILRHLFLFNLFRGRAGGPGYNTPGWVQGQRYK